MVKISIFDITFNAPDKKLAGDIINAQDAKVLNFMWRKGAAKALKVYAENHPSATEVDFQIQLPHIPLNFTLSDIEIENEAINIAYETIATRLRNDGLPVPPGILTHARELASISLPIQQQAKRKVLARYTVVNSILQVLNGG
jgi:hypothetical protein